MQLDTSLTLRVALNQVIADMREESLSPGTAEQWNASEISLASHAFDIQKKINQKFNDIANSEMKVRMDELDAQMAQSITLSFLCNRLKRECPQCK